jgi:hypothetical protein
MKQNRVPRRLLFLGNSHTYAHDVPKIILNLMKAAGYKNDLYIVMNTDGGVGLEWHWQNSRSRNLISLGTWDYVVLQERSRGPLEDKNNMFLNARLLDGEIRKTDARTVFYMTWANQHNFESQRTITDAYREISREVGAILAPVGCPHLPLYEADGRHASIMGAYLAACVFFVIFSGESPEGLPGTLTDNGVLLCDLPVPQSQFLQRTAFQTVAGA